MILVPKEIMCCCHCDVWLLPEQGYNETMSDGKCIAELLYNDSGAIGRASLWWKNIVRTKILNIREMLLSAHCD